MRIMNYNLRKRLLVILCCIALFVSGIYYDTMAAFFLSKEATIGYLFVTVFLLICYVCFLKYDIVRIRYNKDSQIDEKQNEIWHLKSQLRDLETKTKKRK